MWLGFVQLEVSSERCCAAALPRYVQCWAIAAATLRFFFVDKPPFISAAPGAAPEALLLGCCMPAAGEQREQLASLWR